MSRSRRNTPIFGNTRAPSERVDKDIWHRKFRRVSRSAIKAGWEVLPHFRDMSSPWKMDKDGKRWWGGAQARDMRK